MAQTDLMHIIAASATCGILFHFTIMRLPFEFELLMFHFLAAYSIVFFSGIFMLVEMGRYTLLDAFLQAFLAVSSFNTAILLSISTYRLFFHRCRKFSGPKPAKLSRFYATYQSAKDVLYYKELQEMHAHYGDFVRTGRCSIPRRFQYLRS
jgi:hypothetical protein